MMHDHVAETAGQVMRGRLDLGFNEGFQFALDEFKTVQEHDVDVLQSELDAAHLFRGFSKDLEVELGDLNVEMGVFVTFKPHFRNIHEFTQFEARIHETSQPQKVEVVIVACAVVREDPQFLGITSLAIASIAKGSTILAGVVVVVLALHDVVTKKDVTMLATGS
jgi:hypothetical protein